MDHEHRAGLYPALLKHWRGKRGLSQLDLALAADVSSRHVSFLETGRSTPSAAMVARLAAALDVPLRHVNTMLQAAGHEPAYPEPKPSEGFPPEVAKAIALMKKHHDPYPLVVVDRVYNVLDLNHGALALFGAAIGDLQGVLSHDLNLIRLAFDPRGARDAIVNFDEVGRELLWRVQREVLADPNDSQMRNVLDDVLAMPTIRSDWRQADLSVPAAPTLVIHLNAGGRDLRFITMVTAFQAPQSVLADELRIETWFPSDAETAEGCRALADSADGM